MSIEDFRQPQRQSVKGILLIFGRIAYRFLRVLLGGVLAMLLSAPESAILWYAFVFLIVFLTGGLIYSFFAYKRFTFYIAIEKEEFILSKGVFSTDVIRIPFDRIQQVDLKRSILQRLVGVYGVAIDTAGSKEEEIQIRALSQQRARALAEILVQKTKENRKFAKEVNQEDEAESIQKEEKLWIHRVGFVTLLKVGITKSYLRGFILITAFVVSFYNQWQQGLNDYFEIAEEYSKTYFEAARQSLLIFLVIFVAVLFLSIVVTVGEVLIRHFGLNLQQTSERLEIEMGLKTNTRVSMQPRRLQRLKITTNPIQKRLNLYEAHLSLASSVDNLGKSKIVVPGLTRKVLARLKFFLYNGSVPGQKRLFKPHMAWFNRRVSLSSLPLILIWIVKIARSGRENWMAFLILSLLYLAMVLAYQWFLYKSVKVEVSDEFLQVKQGIWTQKTELLELYKLEGISVKQPFWYRGRRIYNITLHTAAGDKLIRALPESFLKECNFILYKTESTQRAWM